MKIVVVIDDTSTASSGGKADYRMLRQFKSEIQRLGTDIAQSQVSGGVLPITTAEYNLVMA